MTDDELLDCALARYSGQEPLTGLEQRVIGRIGSVRRRHMARWWMAGAAAAIGMWIVTVRAPVERDVLDRPAQVRVAASIPEEVGAIPKARPMWRSHRAVMRRAPPFPASPPLTEGERAVLAFVEAAPEQALQSAWEPLVIEEIEIEPLHSEDKYERN